MPKIRIYLDIEEEVLSELIKKYGNVKEVLEQAAKQLASSEKPSIHSVLRYADILDMLNRVTFTINAIVEDMKYRYRNIPPNTTLDDVYKTLIATKLQVIKEILNTLEGIAPKGLKQYVGKLQKKVLEWSIMYKPHGESYASP